MAAKTGLVRSHSVGREGCRTQLAVAEGMQADLDMDTDSAAPLEVVVVHLVAAEEDGSF